jgi:hypothetical protein
MPTCTLLPQQCIPQVTTYLVHLDGRAIHELQVNGLSFVDARTKFLESIQILGTHYMH